MLWPRSPKRARIDAIRIELQHFVVEFARRGRLLIQSDEIPYVLSRLFDVLGIVIAVGDSVSGDHRARVQ